LGVLGRKDDVCSLLQWIVKEVVMRILFVTPYVPSRIRVRSYQLIKALAASHEISLVALLCDEYEREMLKDVANYCASVDLVPLPGWHAYANCLRALPTLMPLRVAYYQSTAFVRCLLNIVRKRRIEMIHGELIKVVPALHTVCSQQSIPVVYDSVDCISSYLQQQYVTTRNVIKKIFVYSELKKMCLYEVRSLQVFDHVMITSAHDREQLISLGEDPERVHVVPNGVDTDYFTPSLVAREVDSLVFCGKLDYYPNAQAILMFCRDVLPHIWQCRSQVRLTIVGNNPPPSVQSLSEDKRITVTGYVADIRPYLRRASVALAPLQVAVGMQNKVLEALAMGTPLVATPASCRSLQVRDEMHLLIAEGPLELARAVLRLLEDRLLAEKLSLIGRMYVEEYHSWKRAADIVSNLYLAAVKKATQNDLIPDTTLVS
jgi:sugar transferase (PEP-CTERM/EpsH1 system associated)